MASHTTSPITGVISEAQVTLDFGQYAGKTIADIAEKDPDFYQILLKRKESGVCSMRRGPNKSFMLYLNPQSALDH